MLPKEWLKSKHFPLLKSYLQNYDQKPDFWNIYGIVLEYQ